MVQAVSAPLALALALLASVPSPHLVRAPAPENVESGPAVGDHSTGYQAALAAVEEANLAVNSDPEANLAALATAIDELAEHDLALAMHPPGREALDLSRLNLARALLLTGDEARAGEVMDEVLRGAGERPLPVARFGPTLAEFHDRHRAALEKGGTGAIQVRCELSCRVVIDARSANGDSGPLFLGEHRVRVTALDDSLPPAEQVVELHEAGATMVIHYPAESLGCEPEPAPPPAPLPPPAPPKRLLPRWAEISVTAIGLASIVAGGIALGFDGKCPGSNDPNRDCPMVWEGTGPGLIAIGLGGAVTVLGAVTLSIDEDRLAHQRGRRAMLGWRMQF